MANGLVTIFTFKITRSNQMIDSIQYQKVIISIQEIFPVQFELVENLQFGLEASYMIDQLTIHVNSGFINNASTEKELFIIYAMHETAHFYGFSKEDELIQQTMVNETWADYWGISIGLKRIYSDYRDWRKTVSLGIEQLKKYKDLEQPNQQEQIKQFHSSERPEIHLPLDYRIALYENLLNGNGFPDFVCESRRSPY